MCVCAHVCVHAQNIFMWVQIQGSNFSERWHCSLSILPHPISKLFLVQSGEGAISLGYMPPQMWGHGKVKKITTTLLWNKNFWYFLQKSGNVLICIASGDKMKGRTGWLCVGPQRDINRLVTLKLKALIYSLQTGFSKCFSKYSYSMQLYWERVVEIFLETLTMGCLLLVRDYGVLPSI